MSPRHVAPVLLLVTLGSVALGCAPPPSPTAAAIVDGTREEGEPAVVTVLTLGGIGLCTGTLITPQVVLTAKHCVQGSGAPEPFPPGALTVGVGSSVSDVEVHRVAAVFTTPGAYQQTSIGLTGAIVGVDVGVLVLARPIESIEPIPIRRDRPDDLVGETFTAIGFGLRPDGPAGLKYRGEGTLESIEGSVLFTRMTICQGDSGGPMIEEGAERRVVGVASFGEAGSCPSGRDGYNALFDHLDLIDRAILRSGGCLEVSEESCNSIDDDCDSTIDEGCAPLGAPCADASECAFGPPPESIADLTVGAVCVEGICARPCDATRAGECDAIEHVHGVGSTPLDGARCAAVDGGCEGVCVLSARGETREGDACSDDSACGSGLCADPGDGQRRCLDPCRGGEGQCHAGQACTSGSSGCGLCVDASLVSGLRGLAEPCSGGGDCESGSCDGGVCIRACLRDDECPEGLRCDDSRCLRGARGAPGQPCVDGAGCGGGVRCVDDGTRTVCADRCNSGDTCPAEGATCRPASGEGPYCVPGADESLLGEACTSGSCREGECVDGVCSRVCGASAGAPCPVGFECADVDGPSRRCVRASGGCSAAAGLPGSLPVSVLLLVVLQIGRRRRA